MLTFYPVVPGVVPGGVSMVGYNLAQALRRFPDLDVHVIHCHSDVARDRVDIDGNLTVHYLALPKARLVPNLITGVIRIVRALHRLSPDLVHAHLPQYAFAGVLARYPTVYTIHGVLPGDSVYAHTLADLAKHHLQRAYERYAAERARCVVAISAHVESAYRGWPIRTWERIDNPVPSTFFDVEDHTEQGRILFVGSVDERKDILMLLRAFERVRASVPGVVLLMAGKINSRTYEQRVSAFLVDHALQAAVQRLGLLSLDALREQYSRCAAMALCSSVENSPMTVIEAQAAGKPVVATRVGGVPELITDGENGFLVPVGDDEQMALRLTELLSQPELGRRMGLLARERAVRFRADRVAAQYRAVYYQALGRAG